MIRFINGDTRSLDCSSYGGLKIGWGGPIGEYIGF